ncbi:hypothetical protein [Mycobacterium lepromatosis]|uniref:hypothetical protein n=1 Tax=Mycobacterium lepromatosis TaxID=480418 RepID=UPI000679BE30|nr:hypothetical protein [Mycobacterium lepromatosis]
MHPALDRQSLLALTLRLVSGLTFAKIARALLQTNTVLGKRITGAENKDPAHQYPGAGAARRAVASATTHKARPQPAIDTNAGTVGSLEDQDRHRWYPRPHHRWPGPPATDPRFGPVSAVSNDHRMHVAAPTLA